MNEMFELSKRLRKVAQNEESTEKDGIGICPDALSGP